MRLPKVSRYVVVAMTIRSEIIYRLLSTDSEKTLTVFLATPPWDLKPGETVPLKLQIRSRYGIRQLIWQGDTQILSLTPGAQANSAEGWTLIMPDWQNGEGASNHWRLSVVVEDNQGQRVSSNEITLTLVEPFDALSNDELRWEP